MYTGFSTQSVNIMSTKQKVILSTTSDSDKSSVATTRRVLRKIWLKCTRAEEGSRFLASLLEAGVGTASVERFILKEGGNRKSKGGKSVTEREELVKVLMKGKLDDSKKLEVALRHRKAKLRKKVQTDCDSGRMVKNVISKLRKEVEMVRCELRKKHADKIIFLVQKYGMMVDKFRLPDEVRRYEGCEIFKEKCRMAANQMEGPVIVQMDKEKLEMSDDERNVLAKGPKFCIFKRCDPEQFQCGVEKTVVKYKWDVGQDGKNNEVEESTEEWTDEERQEQARLDTLAEEIEAETRNVFEEESKTFNLNKRRVTDCKANSRVILPRALPNEEESKLEVLRMELLEEHRRWTTEHCDCSGNQEGNLSKEEKAGLKSLRKRINEGDIVVLPTDKSGKFAIMSMSTYMLAGEVHTSKDTEVCLGEVQSNQRKLNGHVSMLCKIFKIGSDWQHEGRVRETMVNNSLAVAPLYLLYKDHKGWTWERGTPPPTRPVASGNRGMNLHLSEVVSSILEPVANTMPDTAEVISCEDMKSRWDRLNEKNVNWMRELPLCGTLLDHLTDHNCPGNSECEDGELPSLCTCEEDEQTDEEMVESCGNNTELTLGVAKEEGRGAVPHPNTNTTTETQIRPNYAGRGREESVVGEVSVDNSKDTDSTNMNIDKEPMEAGRGREESGVGGGSLNSRSGRVEKMRLARKILADKRKGISDSLVEGGKVSRMEKRISSKEVDTQMIQDRSKEMVIIGSDVVGLYPCMIGVSVGEECYQAVMGSGIKFEGVDYKEGTRYLALNWTELRCRTSRLRRVLPWRRYAKGTRPGVTGQGPLGPDSGDEDQWVWPKVSLTDMDRLEIVAEIVRLSVETLFTTHIYSFAGKYFKQKDGGPIGLRSTCAAARIVMSRWDSKWRARLTENNIMTEEDARYMDDGRSVMYPLRPGWRWVDGGLWYCGRWEMEDRQLSDTLITERVVHGTMMGIEEYLEFTMETGEEFEGGWLPTLDINLKVDQNNQILYKFFEKPTASKVALLENTALGENMKIQSLVNDCIRRMGNTSEKVELGIRLDVVDKYGQKLLNSGYSLAKVRGILISGLKGYERKLEASREPGGKPYNQGASATSAARRLKKLTGKTSWFRKGNKKMEQGVAKDGMGRGVTHPILKEPNWRPKEREEGPTSDVGSKRQTSNDKESGRAMPHPKKAKMEEVRTASVLFVEQSRGGTLATCMKKVIERLTPMLGFKVKVQENAGTRLQHILSNTDPWSGANCGREDCITCNQGGENLPNCTKRNLLYESVCTDCNQGESRTEDIMDRRAEPSIYVGETSRSIFERAKEHCQDARLGTDESHMLKHWTNSHRGGDRPTFKFNVIQTYPDSLSRQIGEAVRIQLRANTLNSMAVFNRSRLTRLVVDREWEEKVRQENKLEDERMNRHQRQLGKEGEREMLQEKSHGEKRQGETLDKRPRKRARKLKHPIMEGVWGEKNEELERTEIMRQAFLYEESTPGRRERKVERQLTLAPLRGVDLWMRQLLWELANRVIDVETEELRLRQEQDWKLLEETAWDVDCWEEWTLDTQLEQGVATGGDRRDVTHTNIKSTIWRPKERDGGAPMEVEVDRDVDMETDLDDVDKERKLEELHYMEVDKVKVVRKITDYFKPNTKPRDLEMEWEDSPILEVGRLDEERGRQERKRRAAQLQSHWKERREARPSLLEGWKGRTVTNRVVNGKWERGKRKRYEKGSWSVEAKERRRQHIPAGWSASRMESVPAGWKIFQQDGVPVGWKMFLQDGIQEGWKGE